MEHLAHDVRAADELALHIELGDGRPVGEGLDALAQLVVLQHVDADELVVQLAQRGIRTRDLAIETQSLEDVFMDLTGRGGVL